MNMPRRTIALWIIAILGILSPTVQTPSPTKGTVQTPSPTKGTTMQVAWADEGNGAAGAQADATLWQYRPTDQWQNPAELQNYTVGANNAYYDGAGNLVIKAIKETSGGKAYSSARLRSPKLWIGGIFEARISIPSGLGIWPAFWLLGEDGQYGWPYCGEVDIMEAPASTAELGHIHQGTHTPSATGADVAVGVPTTTIFTDGAFHLYAIDWQRDSIEYFVDGKSAGKVTRANVEAAGGLWVFDHRAQSPILNLAVGGWAGTPDPTWTSQTMLIDYVRIYQ